jgi:cytoskeleton protein RodZ
VQSPVDAASAGPEEGQGAPVVDGRKQVVITFNAPSWVDVRDSERKFKLFGEVSKGSRKVLGGQPPYKMVIGNAQAVSITVNGEPFDLTRYAKGNVARFTLDP